MSREWTTVDKAGWGPGAWNDEPDKIQWIDPATDLDCLMVRQPRSGHWCGYVGVAEGHPAFEREYDAVHDLAPKDAEGWPTLSVHGGLTFSGVCQENAPEGTGICHVPEPGRPERIWWLGFDCAHYQDLAPAHAMRDRQHGWPSIRGGDIYRDRAYVEAEVTSLAQQLAALVTEPVPVTPSKREESAG